MRRWLLRNLICRFTGHVPGRVAPFFEPWYGGMCKGSLHCARCGAFIQEVNYLKGVKA